MSSRQADPLRELRLARRWAFAGIAVAVALMLPAYGVLLGLTPAELLFVILPGVIAALCGMEIVSRWEYRMHRRYAYPHRLGYELASIHEFRQACEMSADLLGAWLQARAAVVAWLDDEGKGLAPVAAFGMPEGWVDAAPAVPDGAGFLYSVAEAGPGLPWRSAAGVSAPWFSERPRGTRVVYIPLVSHDHPEGVVALLSGRHNPRTGDHRLLAALGMVMGLSLDNCRLYEGQRDYAKRMQELNRMKSDFLSTVSHELRTPLTSIMMAAEMLREDEDERDATSSRARLVRNIVKGASRLRDLVSDLVNISRHDDFRPRLELDTVALADAVNGAVSIIQPLVNAKRQSVEVRLNDPDGAILVDRLRFEQVLINLLSNAQRYSPPGGHILVSSRTEGADDIICVADSGPGVAPGDRDVIFEPFFRGDRSGLGLGLAIARSIVELHGGRIWVEGADGRSRGGATFCVSLPSHRAAPARLPLSAVPGN